MIKSVIACLLFVVPLIGMSQSARKTNKALQTEYTSLLKTYDSLYLADAVMFSKGKEEYKSIGVIAIPISTLMKEIGTLNRRISDLSHDLSLLDIGYLPDPALENAYKAEGITIDNILNSVSDASKEHAIDQKESFPATFPGKGSVKKQNEWLTGQITEVKEQNRSLQTLNMRLRLVFLTFESSNAALTKAYTILDSLKGSFAEKLKLLEEQKQQAKTNYSTKGPKGFNVNYAKVFPDAFPAKVVDETRDYNPFEHEISVEKIPEPAQEPEIYTVVEEYPEFPGGMAKLKEYLKTNLMYPEVALELGIEGKCYLQFVVSVEGTISNIKVKKGVTDCKECDKEAIRLVRLMPKWTPGKINGKPVNSTFTLPVAFKLPE